MSGSRHDWLDDETAERLLSGKPVQQENGTGRGREELPALLEVLSAARGGQVQPEREDAAVAAFRSARAAAAAAARGQARAGKAGWLRRLPGSAKVAVTVAFAAMALVGGVAAAAGTGVLPLPFGGFSTPNIADPGSASTGTGGAGHTSQPTPGTGEDGSSQPSFGGAVPSGRGTGSDQGGGAANGKGKGSGAQNTDALCRSYLASEHSHGQGNGLGQKQWEWLSQQAGGDQAVDSYCRQRLGEPAAVNSSSGQSTDTSGGSASGGASGGGSSNATTDSAATAGAASGNGNGGSGNGTGGGSSSGHGSAANAVAARPAVAGCGSSGNAAQKSTHAPLKQPSGH